MSISNDQVEQIKNQTIELGELILTIKPQSDREWSAFEKLVTAHLRLLSIDTDSLHQLEFAYPTKE